MTTPNQQGDSKTLVQYSVNGLISTIEKIIGNNEQITPLNIAMISINLMQVVEQAPRLSGSEKKKLVMDTLTQYLTTTKGDLSLLGIVPSFIDHMIALDKGTLTITLTPETVNTCCLGLIALSSKK